jgi:subtilisin family serine protease
MKKNNLLFVFLFIVGTLQAIPDRELIIQLQDGFAPETFEKSVSQLQFEKTLMRDLNLHLFSFTEKEVIDLQQLEQHPMVAHVMRNEVIELRNRVIPNDRRYGEQWSMERIGMPEVWNITTGGQTAKGDDIVVAVIDADFSTTHEDIVDNIWQNRDEIAGNGIDDDNNGYVDDVNGWNFGDNSPELRAGNHGTSVAGIIGAKGDNRIGIAGMNWDVQMMPLTYDRSISEIFSAYDYIVEMRRRYNESGGAEGAFIVALNGSFGLNSPQLCPANDPWNQAHNLMGEVGVLIAVSGDNTPLNTDETGDIPSTCPSDYIISVVATEENDVRWTGSATGKIGLDIGAPGWGITTIEGDKSYTSTFNANSSAAPHVAGAIALLYSLESEELAMLALSDPPRAARIVRQAILESAEPLPSLEGIVGTGGRLNMLDAIFQLEQIINPNKPVVEGFELTNIAPNPVGDELQVSYATSDVTVFQLRIFDSIGRLMEERAVAPCCFKTQVENFDVSRYASGVYFVHITHSEGEIVQSFVKS